MSTVDTRPLKVAIVHHDSNGPSKLDRLLAGRGLDVVLNTAFTPDLVQRLSQNNADVLLVDLENGESLQSEYLDTLFEQLDLPIVFSDSDVTIKGGQTEEELGRNLYNKLTSLFGRGGRAAKDVAEAEDMQHSDADTGVHEGGLQPSQQNEHTGVDAGHGISGAPAHRVWVLTGSIGGIAAIRRFLSSLPDDLPIGFIVAQYLTENIVEQATRLMAKGTSFHVCPAQAGQVISHHDVIVLPMVDESLNISDHGEISLAPAPSMEVMSMTIDDILTAVAKRYGRDAGAIVFSGVGRTGIDGCRAIVDHGGVVWTQDAESCRFDSMPQYVRDACQVSFTATPELLAQHLADDLHSIEAKRAQQINAG